ncbi:amidohydrolase family protein [Mycobacteroides abscessus]|uniref:amidohydrolase family protein n=1 Tax=Mycobacteroides abscessus TaxID=36809 RepID=UPI0021059A95|nr:amidohydrolase family protein [Mycobacteroides abscessus]
MSGWIGLEEHYENPAWNATGDPQNEAARDARDYFEWVKDRLHSAEKHVEDLDQYGGDYAIVSLTQPGIEGVYDTQAAIDLAKRHNDYVAETYVRPYPSRLGAFATVPLQDPEAAAAEAERAVKDLGLLGVNVNGYTNLGDANTVRYLDEPPVEVFWAKIAELGVPVYLHPRDPIPAAQRVFEGYAGLLGSAWGFGVETGTHVLRILLSGLFDKYPAAKLLTGHLGENVPLMLSRLQRRLNYQVKETQGAHEQDLIEYYKKNVYVTTAGHFDTHNLLATVMTIGIDRVLFSVDYPYETIEDGAGWWEHVPLNAVDKGRIGRENAVALFNLPDTIGAPSA